MDWLPNAIALAIGFGFVLSLVMLARARHTGDAVLRGRASTCLKYCGIALLIGVVVIIIAVFSIAAKTCC